MEKTDNKIKGSYIFDGEGMKNKRWKEAEEDFYNAFRVMLLEHICEYTALSKIRDQEDKGKKVHRSHHDIFGKCAIKIFKGTKKVFNEYY